MVRLVCQLSQKKVFNFMFLTISNNDITDARICEVGALIALFTFQVLK